MLRNLDKFNFSILLRTLNVSSSGFYAWRARPESQRSKENKILVKHVTEIHQASRKTYGSPRVHAKLKMCGVKTSRSRVAKLMRGAGLRGKSPKKYRVFTTNSKHGHPIHPNILNRDFKTEKPNQKWATDITYLPTTEGWLYLAVVQDLFSRRIVGWAMSNSLEANLVVKALKMAQVYRRPKAGIMHHSDRGVQYASQEYAQALSSLMAIQSMSRRGNCWDNSVCESFFATLKTELELHHPIWSREVTKGVVFEWIEVFYNRQRLHSTLGYLSPVVFEQQWFECNYVPTKP